MTECPCMDEETEACAYNEHNKCDQTTIPHMCMCACHWNDVGDRFFAHGRSWMKLGEHNIRAIP